MRSLILIFTILISGQALAKKCEVYGISDSPQKLTCQFPSFKVELTCKSGVYFLNTSKVSSAYHLEVEHGPVPLVFEAKDMELTVLIEDKIDILADLTRERRTLKGSCL